MTYRSEHERGAWGADYLAFDVHGVSPYEYAVTSEAGVQVFVCGEVVFPAQVADLIDVSRPNPVRQEGSTDDLSLLPLDQPRPATD